MGYKLAPLTGYPVVPEIPNTKLPEAVLNDKPYPVRAIIVQATNPVMSDPNRERVQEMFAKLDLAVACELFMSETALECDVVLPETSFYEQAELRQGMWLGAQAILCQPAVDPPGEAKPMYEIAKELAGKMGYGKYFSYKSWEDWAAVAAKDLPISLDELKEKGFWAGEINIRKGARRPADTLRQGRDLFQRLCRLGPQSLSRMARAARWCPMRTIRCR